MNQHLGVFMTKKEFIQNHGLRRIGLINYISELETKGFKKRDIQVQLLADNIVKSPRVLNDEWKFFEKVKPQITWK
jgi:hypothetical protein